MQLMKAQLKRRKKKKDEGEQEQPKEEKAEVPVEGEKIKNAKKLK